MQYGILIGRFQPLHKAHQSIIDEIMHDGRKPIIFIGSSNKSDEKNPFSYAERAAMIHDIYGGNVLTLPLADHEDDHIWASWVCSALARANILVDDCLIYYFLKEDDFNISKLLPEFRFKRPTYPEIYGLISASNIRDDPQGNKQYIDGRILKILEGKL